MATTMRHHINLRVPEDLHREALEAARVDDRSLNSWIISVMRQALARHAYAETHDRPVVVRVPGACDHPPNVTPLKERVMRGRSL